MKKEKFKWHISGLKKEFYWTKTKQNYYLEVNVRSQKEYEWVVFSYNFKLYEVYSFSEKTSSLIKAKKLAIRHYQKTINT